LGNNGNAVHQMLLNTQFETNGGNGWFRMLEFLEDGRSVRVRTYSPFLDLWRTDPANNYVIQLSPLPAPAQALGDFNGDGRVDGRDFLEWQRGNSPNSFSAADLVEWQTGYGTTPALSANLSVPEPTSFGIAACLAWFVGIGRGRRTK
jgi:hypothetical protein